MSTSTDSEEVPLRERIAANPRPALLWVGVFAVLFLLEAGAAIHALTEAALAVVEAVPGSNPARDALTTLLSLSERIPTLLSRELVPNQGYDVDGVDRVIDTSTPDENYVFDGPWEGTFLGLSPKYAWLLRIALVYAYSLAVVYWLVRGYFVYREHYRYADWTPRDDVVNRLRSHRWGQFGFLIVFMFLTMALFAPTLGPTTVEQNIREPYQHEVTYFDQDTGEVDTITVGQANLAAASNGQGSYNTGPWQYDQHSRFHPFGTLPTPGKDLFTFMAAGARISLFIGLTAIGISGLVAVVFGLVSAYYKGLVDLGVVVVGDSVMTIPQLLLIILLDVVFERHWISNVYNGALLLALIFGFTGWPFLWRAIRGPAFQVSEQEWVDAARSYGQRASATMQRHMLPYIIGYLLIYGSMTIGGIIIATAALSFLGLGINAPTPEWGRAVAMGQSYVATQSWHISFIPGVLIVLVVTAFNAMGDGIRDAIDPKSEAGEAGSEVAAAGGGGG